jgi:hypothetical protein
MTEETAIKLFNEKQIRTLWDDKQGKWYFSIVDVVGVLTDSPNLRKYWSVLKRRLKAEGSELATNCSQLKMLSADGKFYKSKDYQKLFSILLGNYTECCQNPNLLCNHCLLFNCHGWLQIES